MQSTDSALKTFSERSGQYASSRPHYPAELFQWLAENSPGREAAWDCGTGNGQAAVGLAGFFDRVFATDQSREQIEHSLQRENIIYSVQDAEASPFPDLSFDLITVAQALHWFDFPRFWPEVRRVARDNALFCAWGYNWPTVSEDIRQSVVAPFCEIIAPFWAANNKLLWDGYRREEIGFPFAPIEVPRFKIELNWTMEQLLAYMMTWSAYKRSRSDSAASLAMDRLLAKGLGMVNADVLLPVSMNLTTVAGRVKQAAGASCKT